MRKLIALLVFVSALAGCDAITGEEVGRIKVNQVSTPDSLVIKETTLSFKKDDEVGIWSDMSLEYDGNVALRFRIEILKNGEKFDGLEIDPTNKNITIGEMKTDIMGKTSWSFFGKNYEIIIPEDGNYTFKCVLVASENPTLKVDKAELVFKK